MPDPTFADRDLAAACREWIKGCTCAPAGRPQDCQECTAGFLDAVLKRAQSHGLTIGANLPAAHTRPMTMRDRVTLVPVEVVYGTERPLVINVEDCAFFDPSMGEPWEDDLDA